MKRVNVRELETQHRMLDREIERLDRRGMHMTPPEQMRAAELKKQRLAAKDRLTDLRHSL